MALTWSPQRWEHHFPVRFESQKAAWQSPFRQALKRGQSSRNRAAATIPSKEPRTSANSGDAVASSSVGYGSRIVTSSLAAVVTFHEYTTFAVKTDVTVR